MPLHARVWGLGKFLLLVGALVATFILFALVAMRVALRAREVQVPNLVGTSVAGASKTVADLDLALRIDPNQRPDEKVPAGNVMQQDLSEIWNGAHAEFNGRFANGDFPSPCNTCTQVTERRYLVIKNPTSLTVSSIDALSGASV